MKQLHLFLFAGLLSATIIIQSCSSGKGSMAAAREAFAKKEYAIAGENYKAVYSKTKNKDEKNECSFKTAECYRLANDMKNAENWYNRTVKADPKNTEAQWRLAQTLKGNQKFTEAIVAFNEYKKQAPADQRADAEIKGCENALKWKNEKSRYVVENVKSLNTKWSDFAPVWYKKDQLFFTSDREGGAAKARYGWTGNNYTDEYSVKFKIDRKNPNNIKYDIPVLVDKANVNGKFNDGVVAFDARFGTIYITKCNYENNGKGKNCRIYVSTGSGAEWSAPEPLSFSTDSFTCGHPFLSKDGQTLYFSSDMPGGYGGKDLWFVTYSKKGKSWGDPVNLGATINTEGDEMFPFLHEDGTLYFASNGHVGLGGTDIFYTKGEAQDWSTPVNMKSPINSGADDFAIILDKTKETGYFSSTREGGKGQDDIYRFHMNPLIFTLSGIARDSITRKELSNTVLTIKNSNDTAPLVIKTDNKGYYKITLKAKTDYSLFGAHEDYYDSKHYDSITTRDLEVSTDLVQDLELNPFDYESAFTLEGIYYDLDKANIRPDAKPILDTVVYLLNHYPKIRLELGSHTDCRADSAHNRDLAQRRADSAVAYIVTRGIDAERLVAKGYGESSLVNDCGCEGKFVTRHCTEEEHQMNRRTTIKLLGNDYVPKNKQEMEKIQDKTKTPQKAPQRTTPQRR